VGEYVYPDVGSTEGASEGASVGALVGASVVGDTDEATEGASEGASVGAFVGFGASVVGVYLQIFSPLNLCVWHIFLFLRL